MHGTETGAQEWSAETQNCVAWEPKGENIIYALCRPQSHGTSLRVFDIRAPATTREAKSLNLSCESKGIYFKGSFLSAVKLWTCNATAPNFEKNLKIFDVSYR